MISPLAYVHPEAKIEEGVKIDAFAYVAENVTIGKGTWIGPNATILSHARIGKNCKIFPGAVVSAEPQDLKFIGEDALTILGDDVVVRECVTINRGTADKMKTEVGDGTLLMAYVHVAHDCIIGKHCVIANSVNLAGHIDIEDYVTIGGVTAIQQFLRIGKHAFIGGGSLVRKDVPPFVKAAKDPLSFIGINSIGLSRKGYSREQIGEIQDIYRSVFSKEDTVSQGLRRAKEEFEGSEFIGEIASFIDDSKQGVIRSAMQVDGN